MTIAGTKIAIIFHNPITNRTTWFIATLLMSEYAVHFLIIHSPIIQIKPMKAENTKYGGSQVPNCWILSENNTKKVISAPIKPIIHIIIIEIALFTFSVVLLLHLLHYLIIFPYFHNTQPLCPSFKTKTNRLRDHIFIILLPP